MAGERYTFLSFALDIVFIFRSLFGGRFIECFQKCIFVSRTTIDYLFYNAMCYIRNRYDQGEYRLSDHDYTNRNYIPDPLKRPYGGIEVGLRPTNYTDFFYLIAKLLWADILSYLQRNPVPCLIIYIIYNYFPLTFYFLDFCFLCYVAYSLFDK